MHCVSRCKTYILYGIVNKKVNTDKLYVMWKKKEIIF